MKSTSSLSIGYGTKQVRLLAGITERLITIGHAESAWIAMANYGDAPYRAVERGLDEPAPSREGLFVSAVRKWREDEVRKFARGIFFRLGAGSQRWPLLSQIRIERVSIRRTRRLAGVQRGGPATLAVNGRRGRRVACVLDGRGSTVEMLDLEGDDEGTDEAEEGDASGAEA
jgi:hypothetical protein